MCFKKIILCKKYKFSFMTVGPFFILRTMYRFIFMTLAARLRQATERGNLASRLWERDRDKRRSAGRTKGASRARSLVRSCWSGIQEKDLDYILRDTCWSGI